MSAPMLRITPALPVRRGLRPQRMIERTVMTYRHGWVILVSGFFEPLFYLLSVRIGMGRLVGSLTVAGHPVRYVDFVAPALLASSSMNGAVYDSTTNVFDKIKYSRLYDTVLSTPMTVTDVAVGEIGWAMIRGQIYAAAFLVTMLALGLARTWWLLLALPICFLIGLAFAAVGMAGATFMRSWTDFDKIQLVMMPLFLLSASFFPASSYAPSARWALQLSPLYHGTSLLRTMAAGRFVLADIGHVAFLAAMVVAGLFVVTRRLSAKLLA
jgi:lipooligosaccharide transport system permease protein